jgi:hypothetical protein
MIMRLTLGSWNAFGPDVADSTRPRAGTSAAPAAAVSTSFSAQVQTQYGPTRDLAVLVVRFFCDGKPVYVLDEDLLGVEGVEGEPVFRLFDWKDPLWTQIPGTVVRQARKRREGAWYTHAFSFSVDDDVAGVDYFGLRLKQGMFSAPDHDEGVRVILGGHRRRMVFDTPYFILNPKDPLHDVIQIRQDTWMPLLVAAYTLGSAVERAGRPYFSRAIEQIRGWLGFMIAKARAEAGVAAGDEAAAQRQLLAQMLRELWERGPRRLIAFYSGMGYVFKALGLEDMAADVAYDFYQQLSSAADRRPANRVDGVSPRLFAVMLLLGLRTEKARLYVTTDLTEQHPRESYTGHGIRDLFEIRSLMTLFFAAHGQRYAPIKIPQPFDLRWGDIEERPDTPGALSLEVLYKRGMRLLLTFAPGGAAGPHSVSLMRRHAGADREWLGRIVLGQANGTGTVTFISESMTSNFRHLRDINAFKYILLVAAIQYARQVLHGEPRRMVFAADFFDHCAPYDLMLLHHFGWAPSTYDLADYNLSAAEVSPYSGRAMTLPVARIPPMSKTRPFLIIYLLGPNRTSVAVDESLYRNLVARLHGWRGWHVKIRRQAGVLVDGIPYRLVSEQTLRNAFDEAIMPIRFPLNSHSTLRRQSNALVSRAGHT